MLEKQIIHIGFPKTGTTWFQEEFFLKVTNYSLIERKQIRKLLLLPFGNNFNHELLFNKLHKTNNNIIISDERILGGMLTGGYNGLATKIIAERLKKTFPNAKIVLFIRNQLDAIASTYFHYISYGGTYSINRFLHNPGYFTIQELSFFSFEFFNYLNILSLYSELFNDIDIYLYEDFKQNQPEFINKFSKKYDFKINEEDINFNFINDRYRTSIFYLRKFLNIFTKFQLMYKYYLFNIPYAYSTTNKIVKVLNNSIIFGKKIQTEQILNNKIKTEIYNYYKEPNKELIKKYNLSGIKNYSYPL